MPFISCGASYLLCDQVPLVSGHHHPMGKCGGIWSFAPVKSQRALQWHSASSATTMGVVWAWRGWLVCLWLCSPPSNLNCLPSVPHFCISTPLTGISYSMCLPLGKYSASSVFRAADSVLCSSTLLQLFFWGPLLALEEPGKVSSVRVTGGSEASWLSAWQWWPPGNCGQIFALSLCAGHWVQPQLVLTIQTGTFTVSLCSWL